MVDRWWAFGVLVRRMVGEGCLRVRRIVEIMMVRGA